MNAIAFSFGTLTPPSAIVTPDGVAVAPPPAVPGPLAPPPLPLPLALNAPPAVLVVPAVTTGTPPAPPTPGLPAVYTGPPPGEVPAVGSAADVPATSKS